ncbi:hypothetical protein Acsp06_38930 [Actinomycetospora sp. NBRC 106375]|uniref:hypothetical protein n=1 Tax=Actinomycetospora sp. NBRC 106375 TaxID=3032207 RepID=UPI0024A13C53|nr:hypothetical protein [Actinomycetospora sp. NBRC 106375]GLZ47708.1 hypothetical protein Acsp06_38930 [Actinomycetospora sp. NBRC 106375]
MTIADARPAARTLDWPRALWLAGAVLLVAMVGHVVALVLLGGPVSGPVSLRKPATFAETGWLLCWSVAVVLPRLRTRPWQRHVVGATVLAFAVGETAIIAIEAWRGVPSHYNFTTPLDTALMRGGAAGTAAVFVAGVVVLLVTTLRSRDTRPELRVGVAAGVLVLLTGCAVGMIMISTNSGVYRGGIGSGFGRSGAYFGPDTATVGPDLAGFRPATAGGDLVLPHAIGVHGLLLLAVPAVLLAGTALRHRVAVASTMAGAVLLTLAVLLAHAFRMLPLDALGAPALLVLAGCAAAYLGALVTTLRAAWLARSGSR